MGVYMVAATEKTPWLMWLLLASDSERTLAVVLSKFLGAMAREAPPLYTLPNKHGT